MDCLSIPQIAAKLEISDNTVRRYMKRFKVYLPTPVKAGIVYKYPEVTTELIRKIYTWYERGLSKTEIIGSLQSGDSDTTPSSSQQPDKFDVLGGKIDALTAAITGLTTLFTNNATALPAAGQTIEAITGMSLKLLSDYSITPEPQTDIVTPVQEIDDSTASPPQTDTQPPQKSIIETPDTTPTPNTKIKQDTTTSPTGRVKKGESLKIPIKTGIREPADTPPPTGADTSLTGNVTPDITTDIDGYRQHIIELILDLKGQGMTLKEIKFELEKRNLKTLTGKESWAIGTIGKLFKKSISL